MSALQFVVVWGADAEGTEEPQTVANNERCGNSKVRILVHRVLCDDSVCSVGQQEGCVRFQLVCAIGNLHV